MTQVILIVIEMAAAFILGIGAVLVMKL